MELIRSQRDAFMAAPIGKFFVGRSVLIACPDPTLRISAIWGHPDADDARELLDLLQVAFHPNFADRLDAFTDVSAMRSVNPAAFYALVNGLVRHRSRFAARIRRQAFVRPPTLVGAVVGGLYEVVGRSIPSKFFDHRRTALDWLGRTDGESIDSWLSSLREIEPDALAPREREALRYASLGHTNKEIAYEMGISASTVSVLLHRAAKRLRTHSRADLLAAWRKKEQH